MDSEHWTKTGFKKLPTEGPLSMSDVFGRQAPLVVDLGCGNGRFLIGSSVWRPDHNHFGVDVLPVVIRYATRRGNQRGLRNVRFAVCDSETFLQKYLLPGSITEIHCYHPQPYNEPSQKHRRIVTSAFLALVRETLVPGGLFFLQTDNPSYWQQMLELLPCYFDFEERDSPWPDSPKGRTRREIIALRRGLPVFRGVGKARSLGEEKG